jgi:molecular chaperone GrpE
MSNNPKEPERSNKVAGDAPEPVVAPQSASEVTPGQIDKSSVLKVFYQGEIDRRDEEIARLKQDNQRLRAKIISGESVGDPRGGASAAANETGSQPAARDELALLKQKLESNDQQLSAANSETEKLAAELADSKDRLLRSLAELDNVRRRTEREKLDISKYAISEFARDVIGIGDNIQRAIDHVPADATSSDPALKSFLDGVQLLERALLTSLERHGVVRNIPTGERFDPNRHQAVVEQENPDVPSGTVLQVLQPGFMIDERVLRPAVVIVSRGGAKVPKAAAKPSTEAPTPDQSAVSDQQTANTQQTTPGADPDEDEIGG